MKNFEFILTTDDGTVLINKPIPVAKTLRIESSHAPKLTSAFSLLCDYQTRSEMSEDELRRFASARRLFRKRRFARAKTVLLSPRPATAESMNLLGLIHEALREFEDARESFGRAQTLDKDCTAAQMNARRLYELNTLGHSDIPLYL